MDTREAPRSHLEWLTEESQRWEAEGTLTAAQRSSILASYTPAREFSMALLLTGIGLTFLGGGIFWLIISTLQNASPWVQFLPIVALWLLFHCVTEVFAARSVHPVTLGTARTLTTAVLGGVFIQAAASFAASGPHVEAQFAATWGLAALIYAWTHRSRGPLLLGIGGVAWAWLDFFTDFSDAPDGALALGLIAVTTLGVASVLHPDASAQLSARAHFAPLLRLVGVAAALASLFVATTEFNEGLSLSRGWATVVPVLIAAGALAWSVRSGDHMGRVETVAAVAVTVVSLVLVILPSPNFHDHDERVSGTALLAVALGVIAFVCTALAAAVVGSLRGSRLLPVVATIGLVAFATFQSSAVFSRWFEGAWLFIALGAVFLGTAVVFDRTYRKVAGELRDDFAAELNETRNS